MSTYPHPEYSGDTDGPDSLVIPPETIKAKIKDIRYHWFEGTTVTVCMLTLCDGHIIVAESIGRDPGYFNEEFGKEIAYRRAFSRIVTFERRRINKEK